ncbi:Ig-like domain-containing protein, partial [Myxococcota bacterium]|nr:Ig-like domain-containing protein [Myxococcota bacterium]
MKALKIKSILCQCLFITTAFLAACTPSGTKNPDKGPLSGYSGFPQVSEKGGSLVIGQGEFSLTDVDVKAPPLEVIYYSPQGKNNHVREIAVVFNQPLYAMGTETKKHQMEEMFRIEPAVKGQLLYLSGDTMKIELEKPLTMGNRYTVTLKKGVTAVSGKKLEKDLTWHIETPSPRVYGIDQFTRHVADHSGIHPDDAFFIRFSGEVTENEIRPFLHLEVNKKSWPFVIARVDKEKSKIRLWSDRPFPRGATVKVRVNKGFTCRSGPLKAPVPYQQSYYVYSPSFTSEIILDPYVVKYKIFVNPLSPNLKVSFSGFVDKKAFLKHISLRPAAKTATFDRENEEGNCAYFKEKKGEGCGNNFALHGYLRPHTTYTVTVKKGLTDLHGNVLKKDSDVTFITGGYPPGLFLPNDQDALKEPWATYAFKYTNLKSVRIETRQVPSETLIPFLRCLDLRVHREPRPTPYSCAKHIVARSKQIPLGGARETIHKRTLGLSKGINVLSFSSPQIVDSEEKPLVFHRLVLTSQLGIHSRLTPYGATVWVTDLKTAKPAEGVIITIYSEKGWKIASGKTDEKGLYRYSATANKSQWSPRAYVVGQKGQDVAYTSMKYRYRTYSPSGIEHPEKEKPEKTYDSYFSYWLGSTYSRNWSTSEFTTAYLSTERNLYRPGETVHFHGALRHYQEWKPRPAAKEKIEIRFMSPSGTELEKKTLVTDGM